MYCKPNYLMICLFLPMSLISQTIQAEELEKVEVIGQRNQAQSHPTLETEKLLAVAGIDGDPLAAVFSLPGVVYAGGDAGGEPAIRGSSPDDNAFYIDNMPTDYIFHLFGDSIFNKNLLRSVDLEAAAFGGEYGNATGGVFDVKLRDPKAQPLEVKLDASLLKVGVLVEGKTFDNQAFYFSYRRSLIHLFLPEGEEGEGEDIGLTVFDAPVSDDYQGKYQWLIGNEHKLTFNLNGASDSGGINISEVSEAGRIDPDIIGDLSVDTAFDSQGIQWEWFANKNDTISVSVNHVLSESKQNYGAEQFEKTENDEFNLRLNAQTMGITDHTIALGFDIQNNNFKYSFDTIPYFCTDHSTNCDLQKGERTQYADDIKANLYAFYLNDTWHISPDLSLQLGVRAEYDDYTKTHFTHPRTRLTWQLNSDVTLFAKAGKYSRFPDVDTAIALIGNPQIKPPEATHYSAGVTWQHGNDWQSKTEIYHKELSQLPRAVDLQADNADLRYTNDISGTASGVEWLLEKNLSNGWYGWLSLSWSESERTDELTQLTSEYYLDTPWVINSVINYQLSERWEFGLRYSARSGAKYTPIVGLRVNPDYPDNFQAVYGQLNSETLPTYSRLDLQAKYHYQLFGKPAAWTFALINALDSDNISGYYYKPHSTDSLDNFEIADEEGMEVFPSIGLEVTF
ncbi:TonB-dependent receptor [Paraglaciecola aquimarina]|uniref:TonB-dependent receptor n=1 Tax=Paraglaciecola aquimarina TaxID=1235557 RepID=A0ABU3SUF0_9ALTE|nr:TonB-dependent receptor [Paraglaciecola aquimarina]MDU0353629.1 TonB-dependent receptor [Paraglaciecola aquimarina]